MELRQNGGRSAKNQSELPQKAKVKCHKMQKPDIQSSIYRRMLTFDGCSFGKRTKRSFLLSLAQRKKQRNIHPTKASPRGEDATAPPVALTLM